MSNSPAKDAIVQRYEEFVTTTKTMRETMAKISGAKMTEKLMPDKIFTYTTLIFYSLYLGSTSIERTKNNDDIKWYENIKENVMVLIEKLNNLSYSEQYRSTFIRIQLFIYNLFLKWNKCKHAKIFTVPNNNTISFGEQ